MTKIKVSPLSNAKIVDIVSYFREVLGISTKKEVYILKILEIVIPQIDKSFNYRLCNEKDMATNAHAYYDPINNEIVINDDIYERALRGEGRDRMTIAHEIGHYVLHSHQINAFARSMTNQNIKTYEDAEWQANAFAGELLCPAVETKDLSVEELVLKYKVSYEAATVQKNKGGKNG